MKRYILDSGIVTDLISKRNGVDLKAAEAFQRGCRLGVGTPVIGEFLAGLENSSSRERNTARFERLLSRLAIWPYDLSASREYARIASDLRRRGIAVQQIDMQIAALAFALGNCAVVSKDSDFKEITGLPVENWAVP
ncbi:MAG TPA: type II toxin-antitoxin system VapC family toxin [Gemmataceae bacterium]|nr:type II toxin-antitoxin system VapC family toxin [Gemmataceae bacterium]